MITISRRARASVAVAAVLLGVLSMSACSGSSDGGKGDGAQSGDPAASSTTAGTADPAASGDTFTVLTYNVAGLPQEISKEHPAVNTPKISPLLADYDIVLNQESYDWWPEGGLADGLDFVHYRERLWAKAPQKYRTGRHPGPEAVGLDMATRPQLEIGDGLGVLSNFPLADTTRVPWADCFGGFDTSDHGAADCLAMKGFMLNRVTLADGSVLDVYDLHGEAGGSERDQQLQADDFEQLATYIAEHSKGHAVLVGGDTNLHTDRVHEDSGKGADIEIWKAFLEANGLTDACAATTCTETGRIDKVAYRSGKGVDLKATAYKVEADKFVDEDGEDLSDHQAVKVTFSWSPT